MKTSVTLNINHENPNMPKRFLKKSLAFFLVVLSISVGCTPRDSIQEVLVDATPSPSKILLPTSTVQPSPLATGTNAPTASRTPMVTPSLIETGEPSPTNTVENNGLEGAEFYNYGFLEDWRFFVSIRTPKPVVGQYYALIGEKYRLKKYKCEVFPQNPNRLVCSGELTRIDDWVEYTIYPIGSDQPAFQGRISVPLPYDIYPMTKSE
jgi:hypothetical protein